MNRFLLSFACIFSFVAANAQHETDNWYFGLMAGINFSSGTAVAQYGGATSNTEGCSCISDVSGNLIFYTDGVFVWNKNHQQMPNGSGLHGSTSATQSALIVPLPGSTTLYYIFTVDEIGGPNGFEYSIVDMTLDGGLGDVSSLNVHVLDNVTEKLTGVGQDNTGNYWIAVHGWGSDAFYVYLLTSTGLQTPVISHTGIVHRNDTIQNTFGQMKFNPCGNMIGAAIYASDTVQIFTFDNAAGVVSNPITLPLDTFTYGLEFSANSSKLYVSERGPVYTLFQYDLDVLNEDSIRASQTGLSVLEDTYGLQLGSDGKVYVCRSFSQYLGVVNDPNLTGFACNYDNFGLDLDPSFNGVMSALSLPGFVTSWLLKDGHCIITNVNSSDNIDDGFSVYPNPTHGDIEISVGENLQTGNWNLEIADLAGRQVYSRIMSANSKQETINNKLPAGLYLVMLQTADRRSFIKKLIVE
jgi:hypothetical protein